MSETNVEDGKKQEIANITTTNQIDCENPVDHLKSSDENNDEKSIPSPQQEVGLDIDDLKGSEENNDEKSRPSPQQEEEVIKKKYGGILPRKPPLISKDHERAFFDSADWALGKQGAQKPKGPLEALRPKLQPTPNQQVRSRRSAYAPADGNEEGDGENNDASLEEDQGAHEEVVRNDNNTTAQN